MRLAEVRVRPPWPYRLPMRGGEDRVMRVRGGVARRLLEVSGCPVLLTAWQPVRDSVLLRAEAVDPRRLQYPGPCGAAAEAEAGGVELELALARFRFALGVDDDLSDFRARFGGDRLLGPLIRRMPELRVRRRPWPWEALAWAITKQLIDTPRAAAIQRRMVARWGAKLLDRGERLADVPAASIIAGRAPAELQALDLAGARAIALRHVARDVAAGRVQLGDRSAEDRLRRVPGIGPWTLSCLGLFGRGEPDSLPAGDLAYLKLVGRLRALGRRATPEEVEDFYAPYRPYRGWAGQFTLAGLRWLSAAPRPREPGAARAAGAVGA